LCLIEMSSAEIWGKDYDVAIEACKS